MCGGGVTMMVAVAEAVVSRVITWGAEMSDLCCFCPALRIIKKRGHILYLCGDLDFDSCTSVLTLLATFFNKIY